MVIEKVFLFWGEGSGEDESLGTLVLWPQVALYTSPNSQMSMEH
jgi:hypothetical protein